MSGFGYGDASLETGISQVGAEVNFITEVPGEIHEYDLFLFMNSSDYICYVEAVNQLYRTGARVDCDFRQDRRYAHKMAIPETERFSDINWLTPKDRTNNFFFVIDNTEWPEALDYPINQAIMQNPSSDYDI